MTRVILVLAVAGGCSATPAPTPPPSAGTLVYLTPPEHLTRASMALRGIRPSIADLRAVAADPGQLPGLVDGYLASPELGATVRELHNEVLLLRIERGDYTPPPLPPIADKSRSEIASSVYDEPLRLIEDIVTHDQPYTQIVTADYTMADPIVAAVWGMAHSDGAGWEHATWPDGRPAAGILVSPAFNLRYRSAAFNYNRGRANAVARGLLCHDFLDGDVQIDTRVDLSDQGVVANALVANPACAACHQTLDPLASYFFPFEQGTVGIQAIGALPFATYYDPLRATDWFLSNNRPPGFFGHDAPGLDGLGRAIAADPRFARCAAIHFASYLTEVEAKALPDSWIAELQESFKSSNYNAKQLARAVVLSDRFRVAYDSDLASAEGLVGYQKVRPAQLGRMLHALTGWDWRAGPIDLFDNDTQGYRVLAGGIDSFLVIQPVHTMTPTSSLVVQRAAYLAASFVVAHDAAAAPSDRTLLGDVLATDEPTVRAELAELHGRIFGELDPELDAGAALFRAALATSFGDAKRAWVVTLTAMLSDLRAVYY